MAEKNNATLLYEIIDTLTDEEFQELLNTLAISDKADDVIVKEKTTVKEEDIDERVKAIQEKLVAVARKKKIQEKLSKARSAKESKSKEDEIRAKIQERLEVARRKKAIQERVTKLRQSK